MPFSSGNRLKLGDHVELSDARGGGRTLLVVRRDVEGVLLQCDQDWDAPPGAERAHPDAARLRPAWARGL